MKYNRQGHCVYHTRYHLVVTTKYRRRIFNAGMSAYLKIKVKEVEQYYPEIQILEVNTDQDHMHLLLSIPPKMPFSYAVNIIKANTGRAMRKKFSFLDKVYWGKTGIWSIGYFVSTIGINESVIREYIENQGKEDSGRAELELGHQLMLWPLGHRD